MVCEKLFSVIDGLNEQYCDMWETVCNMESPTHDKARVDAVGSFFLDLAKARGWKTEVMHSDTAGNAVCITLNPASDAPPVTFSGHIDTVHPAGLFGTPPVRRDKEKIYGPGVMDCKGGVVASVMAMDALERCGFTARPVQLIIQTDEETGSKTSGQKTVEFMCEKAKNSAAFLNTEGIEKLTAVLIRKGILRYRFTVSGRAVHSAICNTGASAIAEAAHKILALEQWKDPLSVTCNCGTVQGGTAANSVADRCTFAADFRFVTDEDAVAVRQIVRDVAETTHIEGCSCLAEQVSYRPAMPLCERNRSLLERMNRIYEQNGLPRLEIRFAKGGSDAAYITAAGIPCADSLGVEGGRIHSVEEYAWLESLRACAKRLASVAYCL